MKYLISCESSADLSQELYQKNDVKVLPFPIILGTEEYTDGRDIDSTKIFNFVQTSNQLPKTAALNEFQYAEFFENIKEKDCCVIHFSLSSKISSTYSHAVEASKKVPNVYVIDSLSLSTGIGLQVLNAVDLCKQNLDITQMLNKIIEYRNKVKASFVIEKLNYLYKGGRCTGLQLFGANMLNLHPSIKLVDGKMLVGKKYPGKIEKVLERYMIETLENTPNINFDRVFLTCSSATPRMLEMANTVISKYNFKEIYYTNAGATVTSHCGPNTMGILFATK